MSRTSRRRKRGELGLVRVRVMAEYGSSGLWRMRPVGPFRHAGIGYEALRLPPELVAQFAEWSDSYLESLEYKPRGFCRTGRELAHALKAHLGPESYVEFVPESEDGGLAEPEVIEQPVSECR